MRRQWLLHSDVVGSKLSLGLPGQSSAGRSLVQGMSRHFLLSHRTPSGRGPNKTGVYENITSRVRCLTEFLYAASKSTQRAAMAHQPFA
jgi:hypothetical protein